MKDLIKKLNLALTASFWCSKQGLYPVPPSKQANVAKGEVKLQAESDLGANIFHAVITH